MTDPEGELVPLAQAGISAADIDSQVQKFWRSETFEGKRSEKKLLEYLVRESLAGNLQRLRVAEITDALFDEYVPGDTRVRREAGKLRDHLEDYYAREAEPAEIRFAIPTGQYVVHARSASAEKPQPLARAFEARPVARILEPARNDEVYQRVTARGRIDSLSLDLRLWLVIETPVGDHYPQCRVRRDNDPEWEEEVRIGRLQWASDEGAIYKIKLVVADADGDATFFQYLRAGRDGFGPLLPSDSAVLDDCLVTRRDVRPKT